MMNTTKSQLYVAALTFLAAASASLFPDGALFHCRLLIHSPLSQNLRRCFGRTRSIGVAVCLAVVLCAGASAQAILDQADDGRHENASAAPVAYIYVSNTLNPTAPVPEYNVYAYSAAADGKLTPMPNSPFRANVSEMKIKGKFLLGLEPNESTIDTFSMAPNGVIKKVESTNTAVYNPGGCGVVGNFSLDHSSADLYNVINDHDCVGTHFQFFDVNNSNGKLNYVGDTTELAWSAYQIAFLGNNKYAYSPFCSYSFNDDAYHAGIYGFHHQNSGSLADLNLANPRPKPEQKKNFYCPYALATDPTNHIAALLQEEDADGNMIRRPVIAVYTADANGKLTTTSTYRNMPVAVTYGSWMRPSPSGKLLAVGGEGLEIFHFNGGNAVTKYKLVPSTETIWRFYWDNDNHLYVIGVKGQGEGKLYVYTITPTSFSEAPGSPYRIPNPADMIVQPNI